MEHLQSEEPFSSDPYFNRKQANEIAIGRLLLSTSVPEDQEESRLIGLEVLMAPRSAALVLLCSI